ncbi:P-loop containing nucleoside triphosphate hydrolase protein [Daedaleopsis nitida]|nr:P-loop containing nucleoside triphosphate hydrolase protein [Daedaleopsis nitida]
MSTERGQPSRGTSSSIPNVSEVRARTLEKFGQWPCLWQCQVAIALLKGDQDIICITDTGSGKTLMFWMPLLFRPNGVQFIITPLNILGTKNQQELAEYGIEVITISGETATPEKFKVASQLKHGVVVLSPKIAFHHKLSTTCLWRNAAFTSRIISCIWDKVHCVISWGSFLPDLAEAGRLRSMLPTKTPYYMPSATLAQSIWSQVVDTLQACKSSLHTIQRSNDQPNVYLAVREIQYSLTSFKNLNFLIPDDWTPQTHRQFLVFFDNIEDSVSAAQVLCEQLLKQHHERIFRDHRLYGLFCTDLFGMGVDIPDIEIVVQWRVTCNLDTLWQWLGRAGRKPDMEPLEVIFVESKYLDNRIEAAKKRLEKQQESNKEKQLQMPGGDGDGDGVVTNVAGEDQNISEYEVL